MSSEGKSSVVGPRLVAFFIYNPLISTKEETAHENILYYFPSSTNLNLQMNDAGFCTAAFALQDRFLAPEERGEAQTRCRTITTAYKRYTVRQVEPDFWVAVITTRGGGRGSGGGASSGSGSSGGFRGRDGAEGSPGGSVGPGGAAAGGGDANSGRGARRGGAAGAVAPPPPPLRAAQDDNDGHIAKTIDSLVVALFERFRMLHGSLQDCLKAFRAEGGPSERAATDLARLLEASYCRKVLSNVHSSLSVPTNFALGSFLTTPGVEYSPIDRFAFLSVASLVAMLHCAGMQNTSHYTRVSAGDPQQPTTASSSSPSPRQTEGSVLVTDSDRRDPGSDIVGAVVSLQGRLVYSSLSLQDTATLLGIFGEEGSRTPLSPRSSTTAAPAGAPGSAAAAVAAAEAARLVSVASFRVGSEAGAAAAGAATTAAQSGAGGVLLATLLQRERALRSSVAGTLPRGSVERSGFAADVGAGGFAESLRSAIDCDVPSSGAPVVDAASVTTTARSEEDAPAAGYVSPPPPQLSSLASAVFARAADPAPCVFIHGVRHGVLTYCFRAFRIVLVVPIAAMADLPRRHALMAAVDEVMRREGHRRLASVAAQPAATASGPGRAVDERYLYHYSNLMNRAVRASMLLRKREGLLRPRDLEAAQILDVLRGALLELRTDRHSVSEGAGATARASSGDASPNGSEDGDAGMYGGFADVFAAASAAARHGQGVDPVSLLEVPRDTAVSLECLLRVRAGSYVALVQLGSRQFALAVEAGTLEDAVREIRAFSQQMFAGIFAE